MITFTIRSFSRGKQETFGFKYLVVCCQDVAKYHFFYYLQSFENCGEKTTTISEPQTLVALTIAHRTQKNRELETIEVAYSDKCN